VEFPLPNDARSKVDRTGPEVSPVSFRQIRNSGPRLALGGELEGGFPSPRPRPARGRSRQGCREDPVNPSSWQEVIGARLSARRSGTRESDDDGF
jgi:hypothetical protein